MNPREVYERNPDFTGREEQFKLRPHEWEFYLRLDGRRSVQEIGQATKLDLSWIAPTVERLEKLALIRAVEIGMEEFYKRFVNQPATPAPAPSASAASAPAASANPGARTSTTPAARPVPATTEGKRVSFSLRRGDSLAARAAKEPELPPAHAPAPVMPMPELVPGEEEFHLKPLLDFVIGQSGGGTVGQLAVYRVFLKVPNELLRQAGIRSLNLVGAEFTFRNSALKRALLAAVEDVLGRPYIPGAVSAPTPTLSNAQESVPGLTHA